MSDKESPSEWSELSLFYSHSRTMHLQAQRYLITLPGLPSADQLIWIAETLEGLNDRYEDLESDEVEAVIAERANEIRLKNESVIKNMRIRWKKRKKTRSWGGDRRLTSFPQVSSSEREIISPIEINNNHLDQTFLDMKEVGRDYIGPKLI